MKKLKSYSINGTTTSVKSILIVDDEYIIASDIKEKVEELGYNVLAIVNTVEEVTREVEKQTPDLVLLDIELGEESGTMVAAEILNPRYIPFIYITSFDEGIHFENAKKTNPYGFLTKPLKKKALQNTVELALYKAENEQIKELLKEKELVLKISEGVNRLRTIQEFFSFLVKELKPIFNFHDVGVFLLTEDGKEHYDLAGSDLSISDSTWNKLIMQSGIKTIKHKESVVESMMNEVEKAKSPVLLDFKNMVAQFPEYPQMKVADILSFGYRDCLATNLKVGDKVFGMFCLNKLAKNSFTDAQLSLFENITGPLSIAVDNIMANENLNKEKTLNNTLLRISNLVATITTKNELFKVLFKDIKSILPYDEIGLFVLDNEKKYHYEVIDEEYFENSVAQELINDGLGKNQKFIHKGSGVEGFMLKGPIIMDVAEIEKKAGPHPHLKFMLQAGLKQTIGGPLVNAGNSFGMLCFNSKNYDTYSEESLKIFRGITEQISVAVKNVLDREEILEREHKKAFQLEFGTQMAEAQDFDTLLQVLFDKLSECVHLSTISLTVWKEDRLLLNQVLKSKGNGTVDISEEFNHHFEKLFKKFLEESENENLKPKILNETTLHKASDKSSLLKTLVNKTNVDAVLQFKKNTSNNATFILQLADKGTPYSIENLRLIDEYLPLIELSITNHIAFLSIEELNFRINQEKEYLEAEISTGYNFGELIGSSAKMKEIYRQISLAAPTDVTVLITGETGTGKELVARAIHSYSKRKNHSIIKINCAALPANLIESELFGHEKGAFTGATQRRIGKFELADKGTIFLDEIGEMPLEIQVKLLRVLQEREFERVGGNLTIKTDVRVIAATNRNLTKEVADNNFRQDLYYRLDVFPISLPALREHKEDIPELALHFIKKNEHRFGKKIKSIPDQALRELMGYDFPGNVRELEHCIEQALITSRGNYLKLNLDSKRKKRAQSENNDEITGPIQLRTYQQGEIDLILNTLKFTGGKVRGAAGAAEILDIHPNTLESKMRRLGIKRKHVLDIIENDSN